MTSEAPTARQFHFSRARVFIEKYGPPIGLTRNKAINIEYLQIGLVGLRHVDIPLITMHPAWAARFTRPIGGVPYQWGLPALLANRIRELRSLGVGPVLACKLVVEHYYHEG